jgi:beta-glucosidase
LPLVKAIKATGKPTIVVFVAGKPVAEPWIAEHADAVLSQFYGGELAGVALADIIFGNANPSGKTSVSWPRDVGTLPGMIGILY